MGKGHALVFAKMFFRGDVDLVDLRPYQKFDTAFFLTFLARSC